MITRTLWDLTCLSPTPEGECGWERTALTLEEQADRAQHAHVAETGHTRYLKTRSDYEDLDQRPSAATPLRAQLRVVTDTEA